VQHRWMASPPAPQIESVEKVFNGVLITFDDGKGALYSAALLYSIIKEENDFTDLFDSDEE
jgi:hypothetical protein